MRISVLMLLGLLAASCAANHKKPVSTFPTNAPPGTIDVVLRQGPERLWHHLGDELLVVRGGKTLLAIRLDQASDYEVPLALTLSPEGRILYWGEYFDDPMLPSAQTTQTLFNCDGRLLQQFKTVLFASFDFANGDSAVITLSLPKEGIEYWALNKVDERHAILSRYIDLCYVDLLKRGGKSPNAGMWGSGAMNCILYCSVNQKNGEGNYRQYQVSLPWPIVNPPGTGFRPESD